MERFVASTVPFPLPWRPNPKSTLVVPASNEQECRLVRGMPGHDATRIAIADDLEQVLRFFQGKGTLRNAMADAPNYQGIVDPAPDFASVKGQDGPSVRW
jgi:predicted ATPase with chaperone activity